MTQISSRFQDRKKAEMDPEGAAEAWRNSSPITMKASPPLTSPSLAATRQSALSLYYAV